MKTIQNEVIDQIDREILHHLEADARMTIADLAKRVGMSGPSVTERMRKLQASGVIEKFTTQIDLAALGYQLEAIVRIKPRPGNLHMVEQMIIDETRFTTCDKVTGDDCFVTRLAFRNISELDDILGPLHERAETSTSIIKSSPIKHRAPL